MASFIRQIFSEDDGTGSASRVLMVLHSIAAIAWGSHVVYHTHALPDAASLSGVTAFLTAPYAVNKMHAAVTAFAPPAGNSPTGNPGT
jgi:hypothetical protein